MEKIEHIGIYACPFGFFRIVEEEGAVVAIDVIKERQGEEAPSEVTDLAARELAEYLAGERQVFTFPYRLVGTPFRLKVWRELEKVPYGETTTYKKLAEAIGRPRAYHAVGGAVGANPLSIVVPCHRVIGTDGSRVYTVEGNSGDACKIKSYSLSYECIKFAGRHDNLFTRILSAPGLWTQRLTTREPDDSMIEVAIASMKKVIPENPDEALF